MPVSWSAHTDRWVSHRIFAVDCLRSFVKWLALTRQDGEPGERVWRRRDLHSYYLSYWAVAETDADASSLVLLLDGENAFREGQLVFPYDAAHLAWHRARLKLSLR